MQRNHGKGKLHRTNEVSRIITSAVPFYKNVYQHTASTEALLNTLNLTGFCSHSVFQCFKQSSSILSIIVGGLFFLSVFYT